MSQSRARTFVESELPEIVREFSCRPGLRVLLSGELGAGKTTFCRELLSSWGVSPEFQGSPTYAYQHAYQMQGIPVDHFDLYRAASADVLEALGILEHIRESSRVALIEWPERLGDMAWPEGLEVISINLSFDGDARRLEITQP